MIFREMSNVKPKSERQTNVAQKAPKTASRKTTATRVRRNGVISRKNRFELIVVAGTVHSNPYRDRDESQGLRKQRAQRSDRQGCICKL
jgi:hypothetical protein